MDRGRRRPPGARRDAEDRPGRRPARAKIAGRAALARRSRLDLPGDRELQESIEWGKQNLADLTQTAIDLRIRDVDEGRAAPPPIATIKRATFVGAGYPDYPWLFATDGEYTAFASVALGQFEPIKAHLRALRDVSDALNDRSGKIAHEVVTDGSVYFGANDDKGNTDESVKFPSAVALVWRWTGDNRFRDDLYDLSRRALLRVTAHARRRPGRLARGPRQRRARGHGRGEARQRRLPDPRALRPRRHGPFAQRHRDGHAGPRGLADRLRERFDATWWDQDSIQYADSLAGDRRVQQQHWIGVTPMEAELASGAPLAPAEHAAAALAERESDCFSGTGPFNRGLFHTGCTGGPQGKGERTIYSLNTAIKAVADGNYGRAEQRRYTDANAAGFLDEQPGALPEVLPSPDFGDTDANDRNIDRCWTCRAMFMQAWGHYGTAWPVLHQQLGVRPDLGDGRLDIVPQIPSGQRRIAGRNIRLGDGFADVRADAQRRRYTTTVRTRGPARGCCGSASRCRRARRASEVRLDGRRVRATRTETTRGLDVTVRAPTSGTHTVAVTRVTLNRRALRQDSPALRV